MEPVAFREELRLEMFREQYGRVLRRACCILSPLLPPPPQVCSAFFFFFLLFLVLYSAAVCFVFVIVYLKGFHGFCLIGMYFVGLIFFVCFVLFLCRLLLAAYNYNLQLQSRFP